MDAQFGRYNHQDLLMEGDMEGEQKRGPKGAL